MAWVHHPPNLVRVTFVFSTTMVKKSLESEKVVKVFRRFFPIYCNPSIKGCGGLPNLRGEKNLRNLPTAPSFMQKSPSAWKQMLQKPTCEAQFRREMLEVFVWLGSTLNGTHFKAEIKDHP